MKTRTRCPKSPAALAAACALPILAAAGPAAAQVVGARAPETAAADRLVNPAQHAVVAFRYDNAGLLELPPHADHAVRAFRGDRSAQPADPFVVRPGRPAFPGPGPAHYGAAPELDDRLIFVRLESEPWPVIALSPWQDVTDDTIDLITRDRPWLERSRYRTDRVQDELQAARNRWLRTHGYIGGVRQFTGSEGSDERDAEARPVEPSAVIRLRERVPAPAEDLGRSASAEPHTRVRRGVIRFNDEPGDAAVADR